MKRAEDLELLRRYREEGCERSIAEVVERHRSKVFRTCMQVLGRHAAAADATQEVFLLLLRKVERLLERGDLASWFYWVALNVSRGHRRSMVRRERAEKEACLVRCSCRGEAGVPDDGPGCDLRAALNALPEHNRTALVMAYCQGASQADVALRLGVPAATLRSRVSAGLRRLRSRLAPSGQSCACLPGPAAGGRVRLPQRAPIRGAQ